MENKKVRTESSESMMPELDEMNAMDDMYLDAMNVYEYHQHHHQYKHHHQQHHHHPVCRNAPPYASESCRKGSAASWETKTIAERSSKHDSQACELDTARCDSRICISCTCRLNKSALLKLGIAISSSPPAK